MRLGILGGTFDPIHNGHLFIAEEARIRFALDRVLFVPNAVSPFKASGDVSDQEHRFEMTRLAVEGNEAFEVSRLEIERPAPSYTVDTLRDGRETHPRAVLFFITGSDAVADIEEWHEPEEVLQLARIIAVTRSGFSPADLTSRLAESTLARIDWIDSVKLDISATDLRARARSGLPLRYLTPDAVVDYVGRHGLYR
jgi:nicotinate-nucleotide adenylyltransferase